MNKKELLKLGLTPEALEKAGLEAGVLDEIIVLHGKGIEASKKEVEDAKAETETAKGQLVEANKAIDGFKKLDPEGIKKAATDWELKAKEWEAKNKETQTEAEKNLAALKFDHALDGALTEAKAKSAKAVKALLDMNNLKLNEADGSIIGLDDQLKKVKESSNYLFEGDEKTPRIVMGGTSKSVIVDVVEEAARKGAGLKPQEK
jgi:hypothetical protein